MTKTLALATVLAGSLTLSANAGGMSEPIMDTADVMSTTQPQGDDAVYIPIIILGILAFVAANS